MPSYPKGSKKFILMGILDRADNLDTDFNGIGSFIPSRPSERWRFMATVHRISDMPIRPQLNRSWQHSRELSIPPTEVLNDVVFLVDDDRALQEHVESSIKTLGVEVIVFASATEHLRYIGRDTASCVIVNTRLPDLSGLELQSRLTATSNVPIIFISDQFDIVSTVRAMKAGAFDFLIKPLSTVALLEAVQLALTQNRKQRRRSAELAKLQKGYSLLTPREREVLPLVVGGLLNKQAASLLGISEVTLQIHRSQIMRKMQADSFADLVRMAVKLRIAHWRENPHKCA